MTGVDIRRRSIASPDARRLIDALNAELRAMFPEPGATHFALPAAQVVEGEGAFLVAYAGDEAVGCGAIRRIDDETAELKRMFVTPAFRRRGVARALVSALEEEARRLAASRIVLETGTRLAGAIRLYEGLGYARIPLFGEYTGSPLTSICFGKSL